jgi:hypothetical protein
MAAFCSTKGGPPSLPPGKPPCSPPWLAADDLLAPQHCSGTQAVGRKLDMYQPLPFVITQALP